MVGRKKPRKTPKPRHPTPRQRLARRGEQRAADYLVALGYSIIARNWRAPGARNELDIIAEDGDCLVFVEVKTARTANYGDPITWITPRKQAAIARAAECYLAEKSPAHNSFRFDTISIGAAAPGKEPPLVHTVAAFVLE